MLETGEHFISLLVALNDFKFSLTRTYFSLSKTIGVELKSLITFTNLKSKRTELVKK